MSPKVLILSLFLSVYVVLGFSQKWEPEMYDNYNYKSFKHSEIANQTIDPSNIDYALLNAAVFYATNEQRKSHSRKQFSFSSELEVVASGHSFDMVEKDFFSHTSRVKGKKTLSDRLGLVGFVSNTSGENIASTFLLKLKNNESYIPPINRDDDFRYASNEKVVPYHTYLSFADDVVESWMQSPGHRKNILHKSFTRLGCGTCLIPSKKYDDVPFVKSTQNFSGDYIIENN